MSELREFDEIVIFGMGFVGLTLAAVVAESGHQVLGIDTNHETIDGLRIGKPHFFEPNLNQSINKGLSSGKLKFETNVSLADKKRIFIVSVGTPLKGNQLDSGSIASIIATLIDCTQDGDMVLLRSTIPVGLSEKMKNAIEAGSGKSFLFAMCPERTLEGSALEELKVLPQIVGAPDAESREAAKEFFLTFSPKVISLNSFEAAELAKLSSNIVRDVRFGLANEIAFACEKFGVNFEEIRIATNEDYPREGLARLGPVAGPCLEKDSWIYLESLQSFSNVETNGSTEISIIKSARLINESLASWAINNVISHITNTNDEKRRLKVLHIGMAFKGKPATDDLRGSDALKVFAGLSNSSFIDNYSWDAEVSFESLAHKGLNPVEDEINSQDFSIVIIHNNHVENSKKVLDFLTSRNHGQSVYVLDLCNALQLEGQLPANITYRAFGSSQIA